MARQVPRVLLVENEAWQAATFDQQLRRIRGIEYLGFVSDYYEVLEFVIQHQPDAIFLDLHFDGVTPDPFMACIENLIPKLKQQFPRMKIVAFTNHPHLLGLASEAGADVSRRKSDLGTMAQFKTLLKEMFDIDDSDPDRLSTLETDTLRLVAQGKSNEEIAKLQFRSESTIKARLSSIFAKLRVVNRTEAVAAARERGYDL
jgi:two-component system, NarL family, response regulator LiaR